jgi:hypothetical protein
LNTERLEMCRAFLLFRAQYISVVLALTVLMGYVQNHVLIRIKLYM